jgi:hypothetical protein
MRLAGIAPVAKVIPSYQNLMRRLFHPPETRHWGTDMNQNLDRVQPEIEKTQRAFCLEHNAEFLPTLPESKLGYALSTKGRLPVNGLRHLPEGDTSGWYIWCGEDFSDAEDFFAPLHTKHVYDDQPELTKLLGLAPGYRFLIAGDHLDVWYDAALLPKT